MEKDFDAGTPTMVSAGATQMPLYIGAKLIRAIPMTKDDFDRKVKNQEASAGENAEGYYVLYPDGYKSWSPKETFEEAYRLCTDIGRL